MMRKNHEDLFLRPQSFLKIISFAALLQSGNLFALAKPGGDFVAGNAAVAVDVNAQFNTLYTALNSGANSINIDSWANAGGNLGYTGGCLGIGIGVPTAKLTLSQAGGTNADGMRIINGGTTRYLYSDTGGRLTFGSASTPTAMVIQDNGLVGIGTAAPGYLFTIMSNVASGIPLRINNSGGNNAMSLSVDPTGNQLIIGDNAGTATAVIASSGDSYVMNKFGVGNSTPGVPLDVTGAVRASSDITTTGGDLQIDKAIGTFRLIRIMSAGSNRWTFGVSNTAEGGSNTGSDFVIRRNNDAGTLIGTNAFVIYRNTGVVRIPSLGSGTVTSDVNGDLSTSSDVRLKNIVGESKAGLSALLTLRGKQWRWKRMSGLDTQSIYEGFIAQDVERLVPNAVGLNEQGYKTLAYHSLLPMFANAIRELKSEKDTQILTLEKRATEAEQRYAAGLRQAQSDREVANRDKAAADARIAALEKELAKEKQARAATEKSLVRVAQRIENQTALEIRLVRLEQTLQRQVVARK